MFRSARGWKTVCALINMTALHPEASQTSFEAFALVCKDDKLLTPANFAPLLETALVFVDRHAKVCHSPKVFDSIDALLVRFLPQASSCLYGLCAEVCHSRSNSSWHPCLRKL